MAQTGKPNKSGIETYGHKDKSRINNPPVGLVDPSTDPAEGAKTYAHDPHLPPELIWAGKAEHTSFDVPTVSLHVHERIEPLTIMSALRKKAVEEFEQISFFQMPEENPPLREAVEFYKHPHGWSNRLIAGDSLLVMNSLIEKEGLGGGVRMVYIDPPYGVGYRSNFQPFVQKRDPKDGKDEDLTQEPEMIHAFRDTWELGIHSYLTYLRDRLLLARELLRDDGSCFVQINDQNLHHVREVMDEVFGEDNFVSLICFQTTSGFATRTLATLGDFLLWYGKDKVGLAATVHKLFEDQPLVPGEGNARWVLLPDGTYRGVSAAERRGDVELPEGTLLYKPDNILSQGAASEPQPFVFEGKEYAPGPNSHWKANYPEGMERLALAGRIHRAKNSIQYRRFASDFPYVERGNIWTDTITGSFTDDKVYAVQTNTKVIERCMLLATDPGDLVFDPTCGSGTTAYCAEKWGRRWITCDTSRISITVARQRLMTACYDYFKLARPDEGVGSGFAYETVPHITLESIAQNPELRPGLDPAEIERIVLKYAPPEVLYDRPRVEKGKVRVTGPFTAEAVPAPTIKSPSEIVSSDGPAGNAGAGQEAAKQGESARQDQWRGELLTNGVRAKDGKRLHFSRLEPLGGTRWLHADGETRGEEQVRIVFSFGPEHAPLEQRQVSLALQEAVTLVPRPAIIAFAAFQFDPEAAKDIDETNWPGVTLLKIQMNTDLLTDDLKKKRSGGDLFWMIGQPDVEIHRVRDGSAEDLFQVKVYGFDYYDPTTGLVESGDESRVALWMLDTDYDGRSLYPRQVFFPMPHANDWQRLARTLRAELDSELISFFKGTLSLPFPAGDYGRVAVKIVDDRGIESLRVLPLD
ncbi:MAG: site-specific DNA-methyltransferase [Armatimonadetes bacterium]|nr:site-specific DNA-methyltransferase [Armatimonadota bacterium]